MALDVSINNRVGWGTEEHVARECAVTLDFTPDVCDPATGSQVLVQGGEIKYETAPVGIIGTLDRPTNCTEDDDASFLTKALKNSTELAVTQALVTQPSGGPTAGVWFGHPDITTSVGTADTAGIGAARSEWYRHTVWAKTVRPILHVPPALMPELRFNGLLEVTATGETVTIWGDEVIFSPAYDWIGGTWAVWTGPVSADVSTVENTGTVVNTKQNRASTGATLLITVDTPPCAIVAVGVLTIP